MSSTEASSMNLKCRVSEARPVIGKHEVLVKLLFGSWVRNRKLTSPIDTKKKNNEAQCTSRANAAKSYPTPRLNRMIGCDRLRNGSDCWHSVPSRHDHVWDWWRLGSEKLWRTIQPAARVTQRICRSERVIKDLFVATVWANDFHVVRRNGEALLPR